MKNQDMKNLILLICFSFMSITAFTQVTFSDSIALVALYDSTDGPNWSKQENWLNGPVDIWQGITVENGRVTEIDFSNTGLNGMVPDSIFNLDALKEFSFRESNAQLDLDQRMGGWSNLELINVSGNMVTVDLPSLCLMPMLHSITFFSMHVGGEIPDCFQDLPLKRLSMANAQLDSALLPDFIDSIPTLTNISLRGNQFYGPIPDAYCNGNTQFLNLGNNALTGTIPSCLDADSNLIQLFLDGNQMDGEVPVDILGPKLTILDLCNNQFTGNVSEWPDLPEMDRLKLANNQFEGTFNGAILQSSNFRILDLSKNRFDELINFPSFDFVSGISVYDNVFDFTDLEHIFPNNANFKYAPQAVTGQEETKDLDIGDSFDISMDAGGAITTYQWFKDDALIVEATTENYSIATVSEMDAGVYHCEAKHDGFPELTLKSAPITLSFGTTSIQGVYTDHWRLRGNPVGNQLILTRNDFSHFMEKPLLRVFDGTGKIMVQQEVQPNSKEILVYMGSYPAGIYRVQLVDGNRFGIWQVVVLD
jgi:Leucine-rich repeat (LRR) protein